MARTRCGLAAGFPSGIAARSDARKSGRRFSVRHRGQKSDKRTQEKPEWNFHTHHAFPAGQSGAFVMATATQSTAKSGATNGTTPADIEKQLETIRGDISELTQQVADLISQAKDDA